MASTSPVIVWFRNDLRLNDNPALHAAVKAERPVIPLFVLDDEAPGKRRPGGASRWWLHHALVSLDESLDGKLAVCRGPAVERVQEIVEVTGAKAVFWNRRYAPWAIEQDEKIKASLKNAGIEARSSSGSLVHEPWTISQDNGDSYKVYTPYSRVWMQQKVRPWVDRPEKLNLQNVDAGASVDDLDLLPTKPDWAGGLRETWDVSENGARKALRSFVDESLIDYKKARDFPVRSGTSRLSPYLHSGQISPIEVYNTAGSHEHAFPFLRQLAWRDFAYHTLYHFPGLPERSLREQFEAFPWSNSDADFEAWSRGCTGFPIVDAGMRELWHTGYMHNRVRMIAGSFLTKDLLIDWRKGAAWFWDTLVDADLANNSMGWQWVAGSGIDAAPYFRIFNPTTQSRKFDGDGTYIRTWVPELADLPDEHIHEPASAPADVLEQAGIELGVDYPKPMVEHGEARKRALGRYQDLGSAAA